MPSDLSYIDMKDLDLHDLGGNLEDMKFYYMDQTVVSICEEIEKILKTGDPIQVISCLQKQEIFEIGNEIVSADVTRLYPLLSQIFLIEGNKEIILDYYKGLLQKIKELRVRNFRMTLNEKKIRSRAESLVYYKIDEVRETFGGINGFMEAFFDADREYKLKQRIENNLHKITREASEVNEPSRKRKK